jgi:flagellar motor protein MotB
MSVNSDGSTSYFATVKKSSDSETKKLQKKQAEKKAEKAKEKKKAEKKEKEEKLEEARLEKKEKLEDTDEEEYVEIRAHSMEDLIDKVSKYAYDNSSQSVMTEEEKSLGQNFDFKG